MAIGELNEDEAPRRPVRHGILRTLAYAFSGLWHLLRTQRNARIEIAIAAAAGALGAWLRIDRVEWAVLATTML